MANYDYRCDNCHTQKLIERSIHSEASNPICDECKQVMVRIWSAPNVSFMGDGWGGDYGKKRKG